MKKIAFLLCLIGVGFFAKAQTNPFPTIDSLERFINRYIRNSPVESFQNLRMNTALIGLSRFIRGSAIGSGVDTMYLVNDTTLRLITHAPETLNVVLRNYWVLDGSGNLVTRYFPGVKVEVNKRFSMVDSGFVATSTLTGTNPGEGTGYKTFWHPGKAAFRSGFTDASSFNNAFIGLYSTSFGYNATASGVASFSAGIGTLASGQGSIALGGSGTQATGNNSIAGGLGSVSSGVNSMAFGNSSNAAGQNSFAAGFNPASNGSASAAFNAATRANADYSTSFGEGSDVNAKWGVVAGQFTRSNYSLVIPQFVIGRYNDTTIGAELFRIGWGSHVGGPKANIFTIDTAGIIRISNPPDGTTGYTVLVNEGGVVKEVDAGDIGGADVVNTELFKGIGVDTSAIVGNPDTLLLEEEYLYTTSDKRVVVANTYVANDGDDADDGETEATAKLTIAGLADSLISKRFAKGYSTGLLKANSVFREQFTPTVGDIRLGAYGLYDGRYTSLPMLSASDALPGGADTASMYKITVTHSLPSGNPGYDYFVVVEIDTAVEHYYPYAARKYLTVATSIANCDATPGSFYQPSMTSPTPVYINPTTGNVGSNKYRYEIAQRLSSVYSTGYTGKYSHIWFENGVSGYGTLGGTNGGVSDIYLGHSVLSGGATHTSVIKSGIIENNVYITGSLGGSQGNTGHVFYEGNGAGNYGVFRRNMMFGFEAFLLSHQGEGVNDPIEYIRYEDNYLFGDPDHRGTAIGTGVVRKADITGNYLEHANAFYRGGAWDNRIINNVFRDIQGESGMEVPTNLSRPSTLVDNLIEFFPPSSGGVVTMWSVNQNLHNVDFNHNTVYIKSENPAGESAQVFARNSAAASNTPFDVQYNIFISSTPTGTFTKMVTVDQNSVANQTAGWVSDFNVYIKLSGSGFRWVVTNPVGGDPNKDGLAEWQSTTNQDDNSIEIDLTANANGLQDIFVDPDNGNWALTNSANADLIRAVMAGKRNPPTFYPKKPIIDEAVAAMLNGSFKSPSEQWQYPNYAGGSSTPADGSETKIQDGTDIDVTGTGTIADPYIINYTGGGGASDTSRLWHVSGNNLGSTGKLGALTGHTTVFISHNIMRACIRAVGGFAVGDTVGLTSTRLASFKNTTELQGIDVLGPISGTTPSINIQTAHTATANSQILEGINLTSTYATGGFTGVSVRPLNLNVSFAGTVIGRLGNIGAGTSEFRVEDPSGAIRVTSAGLVWATATDLFLRPQGTSNHIMFQSSTGVNMANMRNGFTRLGDGTIGTAKLQMAGNLTAANNSTSGILFSQLASTVTDNSTAGSGTVTHTAVNSILTPTLAASNTSVTYTNASSFYIAAAPAAGTNITITNPWSIYVAAGKSFHAGEFNIGSATDNGAFTLQNTGGLYQSGAVKIDLGSDATGDIYYRDGSGNFVRRGIGSTGDVLTVSGGVPTWSTPTTLTASTYTPTFTLGANTDGVTAPGTTLYYQRIGNQITVWGNISVDATAASTTTNFEIDLPVASAMTGLYHLSGQLNSWSAGGGQGGAEANVTNDRANFTFQNGTATSAVTYTIRFSYEVL